MVDSKTGKLEDILRDRIGRFVDNKSKWCLHRHKALQKICEYDPNAFLCGGAARDILLSHNYNPIIPRDLDIVLKYADLNKISDSFVNGVKRWNCYGGVSIQIKDLSLDLWKLSETWAFKKKYVEVKSFVDFPKTTFLDIDAVAVQLFKEKRQKRKIYSKGFFEAILKKTIEINLEDNPNPAMCIIRSLRIANKFKFAIGPRLAHYMVSYTNQMEIEELAEIYQNRYASARVTTEKLYNCFKSIKTQIRTSSNRSVKVFVKQDSNFFEQHPSLTKRNRYLFAMT